MDEGDAEIAKLSAQASKLDSTSDRTKARIVELEVRAHVGSVRVCWPGTDKTWRGRGGLGGVRTSECTFMYVAIKNTNQSVLVACLPCCRVWVLKVLGVIWTVQGAYVVRSCCFLLTAFESLVGNRGV